MNEDKHCTYCVNCQYIQENMPLMCEVWQEPIDDYETCVHYEKQIIIIEDNGLPF